MPENFNPFVPNASCPSPLKTSENLVFRGSRKNALYTNGLKEHILVYDVLLTLQKTLIKDFRPSTFNPELFQAKSTMLHMKQLE